MRILLLLIFLVASFVIYANYGVLALLKFLSPFVLIAAIIFYFKRRKKAKQAALSAIQEIEANAFLELCKRAAAPELNIPNFVKDTDEKIYFIAEQAQQINSNNIPCDIGKAFISDKRFMFLGEKRAHSFEFKNIMRIEEYFMGFKLQSKKDKAFKIFKFSDVLEYRKVVALFNYYCNKNKE